MSNPIDKLFKDKLEQHVQAPSPNTWSKVETGLSKKNNRIVWFRAAAALLLVGSVTVLVLRFSRPENQKAPITISETTSPAENQTPAANKLTPSENIPIKIKGSTGAPVTKTQPATVAVVHPDSVVTTIPEPRQQTEVVLPENPVTLIQAEKAGMVATEKTEKPIVLEYTLADIGSAEGTEPATVTAKEKKGLRKVMEFALDAKNSDGAVSGLRTAKDDLFALNFKKDKHKNSK
jgi:hypothetical protein